MKSAKEILESHIPIPWIYHDLVLKAMREYAAQAITEQLEVAAREAEISTDRNFEKLTKMLNGQGPST